MLFDLVAAGDSEINTTLTDECWDIGGGKEDEGEGQVLDERDVKT